MNLIQSRDGNWYDEMGTELIHIPKTRKCEHLLDEAGEVVAKRCGGLCGEMLPIDSFNRCSKGFAKKRSYCKACERNRKAANSRGENVYGEQKRPIKPKAEREYDEHGVCIRKVCPSCEQWRDRADYYEQSGAADGLGTECRSCVRVTMHIAVAKDPERYKTYGHNRRAKEAALPGDLSDEQWKSALGYFDDACALTGETEDLHLEHAIPIAIGHAGTVEWNCYPMDGSLNCSKSASNLFEWAKGRKDIDKPKFNRLITFLADRCGLTVDEYRAFYYWCFANPRLTVSEIEADGADDSLTMWKRKNTECMA
ncbi:MULTISPECIES: hypothetical protein [Bacillus]|uniref:hypothetical protein n=1 Tax=Bacillus TaxID=1386 RepID=UPI0003053A7F|nr:MULTISPECIES: hypothetical protein [Bacillus]